MRRPGWPVGLIAVAALSLAAVAAVLSAGATHFGAPRWYRPPTATPTPTLPPATRRPIPHLPPGHHFPEWIAVVALILIVLAAAWVVLRPALRARRRRRALPGPPLIDSTSLIGAAGDASAVEADAPVVHNGLRLALDALGEDREPRDAVVAAWLGLQSAAEESGVRRRPAETPTEFTTRVITRVGADSAAAHQLVGVYQAVRFGSHPITADDVSTARAAVEALLASWREPSLRARR